MRVLHDQWELNMNMIDQSQKRESSDEGIERGSNSYSESKKYEAGDLNLKVEWTIVEVHFLAIIIWFS